jgi:ATP synthase protein I
MLQQEKLKQKVEQQARRMRKAEREKQTLMAQTVYLGSLGLMFVLPVIGGGYLGVWLDSQADGYSVFWTISMLLLGIVIGMLNVYFFIRE